MKKKQTNLEDTLRAAIERSGLSVYRIAKDAGVSQPALCLFVNGKRGLTLATASKVMDVLGLEIVETKRRRPRRTPKEHK